MLRTLLALCLTFSLGAAYAGQAGSFLFAVGDIQVIDKQGGARAPKRGDALNEGDTVATGKNGSAQIKMVDNGFIAVKPNTRFTVDTYRYNGKEDGSEKGFLSLLRGGFRTLTGLIGHTHKENYRISTPVGTIGIRGTDHEPYHIPPPAPGETPIGKPGTYDKVNGGAVVMSTPQGELVLAPGQTGYIAGPEAKPELLPATPEFYRPGGTAPSALPSGIAAPPALPPPTLSPGLDSPQRPVNTGPSLNYPNYP